MNKIEISETISRSSGNISFEIDTKGQQHSESAYFSNLAPIATNQDSYHLGKRYHDYSEQVKFL